MPSAVASLREIWHLDHRPLDVELSRDELTRAGTKAPDDDRVWLGRANLAIWEGRFDEAARWLDQCLRRRAADPAVWRAWLFRAQAADDPIAIWQGLEHLTTADLEPAELPAIRAWLARRADRPDLERQALEERVRLQPEDLASYDRLAALLATTPDGLRWRNMRAEVVRAAARTSELLLGGDDDEPRCRARPSRRTTRAPVRRPLLVDALRPGKPRQRRGSRRAGPARRNQHPRPPHRPRTVAELLAAYKRPQPRRPRLREPPRPPNRHGSATMPRRPGSVSSMRPVERPERPR